MADNIFQTVIGYIINMQKLVAFLYINEKKITEKSLKQYHSQQSRRIVGLDLIKDIKDWYNENSKTQIKK